MTDVESDGQSALFKGGFPQSPALDKRKNGEFQMNDSGYVYFLAESNRENPKIKIGKTKHLSQRMEQIQPNLPTKTMLLHSIEANNRHLCESVFHEIFEDKRCNGEWFDLDADDMCQLFNTVYFDSTRRGKLAWRFKRICSICKTNFEDSVYSDNLDDSVVCKGCEESERSKIENQTWMNYG